MLSHSDFEVLKVKASVCPGAESWPPGDVQVEFMRKDGKPSVKGELHWLALHAAKDEARDRLMRVLGKLTAVKEDRTLSPTGKADKMREMATKAITDLEKSQALAKAQAAVSERVKRWDKELAPPAIDPMIAAEIRRHVASLREEARVPFIVRYIVEAGPAVMQAPAFLSGLSPVELAVVKQQFEIKMNPEVAAAKAEAMDALAHLEAGFRNAANQIKSRAGLDKIGNGGGMAA